MMRKVEKLYTHRNVLIEKSEETYNNLGQLTQTVRTDLSNNASVTFTNFEYSPSGQLIKEIYAGMHSFPDSAGNIKWTDASVISITTFSYDSNGQKLLEKEYNFQCALDTCDITTFSYEGKLLMKKQCALNCSMKQLNYNYPIYYQYDQNDSLILEQAWGPTDTTKIWYSYTHDYSSFPEKEIHEHYYRKNDTLRLENRTVTKTEYFPNGKIARVIFIEQSDSYDLFDYYKNGTLKAKTSIRAGKTLWKATYAYNKYHQLKRIKTFEHNNENAHRLKLNYYQQFEYRYF